MHKLTLLAALLTHAVVTAQVPWPTFQGNARHDGALDVTITPSTLVPRWQRPVGPSGWYRGQATAADGKVFVTGPDRTFRVLEASTGDLLWSVAYPNAFSVNPAAYADGKVYLQTCNHSSDTFLRCYEAATGQLVFQAPFAAQWERYMSPTIVDGVVYLNGGYYGGMYAFDGSSGQQLWFQSALPQYDEWTPAVENGITYGYIGGDLYALDAATGTQLYTIDDPGFSWAGWSMQLAPVLGGMNDVFIVHSGRLVRFDLLSHTVAYTNGPGYVGQPAVKDGVVYAISGSTLRALDQVTGDLLWSWSDPVELLSGEAIVTNGHVLVGSGNKTFLIDTATHTAVWSTPVGGRLTIAEGAIYVVSSSGVLTSVGFDAMPTPVAVSPSYSHFQAPPVQVTITGSGFQLGANLTVRFDGIEASGLQILDDHTLTCTVPAHGPGLVDVLVSNSIGQVTLAGGFAYTPALHAGGVHHPGGHIDLSCYQAPSQMIFGAYGTDPIAVAVPPFGGQLRLMPPQLLFVIPGWYLPRFDFTLPVPPNPVLAGVQILFQTLVGPDVPQGAATFSDLATVTLQ